MPLAASEAFSLSGKVIVVTGAAGNVGGGIAEVFAANQVNLVLSDRAGEALDTAGKKLQSSNTTIQVIPADLTNPTDLQALVDQTLTRFGRLDALINCGGLPNSGRILDENIPDFDCFYHTNVRSIWLLSKYVYEPMKKQGGGSIVNIASINAHRPYFFCSLYTGTKAAVIAMTRELAVEFSPANIRVNSVSPGTISDPERRLEWFRMQLHEPYGTDLLKEFLPAISKLGQYSQPLEVQGHGRDVGMACYYLCCPAARFISGTDLTVDGAKTWEIPDHEPRFINPPTVTWKTIRQRLLQLPDSAWRGEKPKWLTRGAPAKPKA